MAKKVMVFGIFDGIHDGHRAFFEEAKQHGDHLIVVVARDQSIAHVYGNITEKDETERLAAVLNEEVAADVVMGYIDDKLQVVSDHNPDVIVFGFSQQDLAVKFIREATVRGMGHIDLQLGKPYNPEIHSPSKFSKTEIHVD